MKQEKQKKTFIGKLLTSKSIIGIVFTVLLLTFMTACSSQTSSSTQTGRAVFVVTDAAADMGNVTSIKITVDNVRVLNESDVWIEVSSTPQTYDLLKLKATDTQALLADYNLTPGTYNQIRLVISKVVVTDTSGDHIAKLPSGELKIIGKLVINENATSTAKFDFIADKSLHITGNGLYIFAPVIKFETRHYTMIDMQFKDDIKIRDGDVDEDREHGMDMNGNMGEGLKIRRDARLFMMGDRITEE